jgi:hypothetical protein
MRSLKTIKGKVGSLFNYLGTRSWRRMGDWRYSSIVLERSTRWIWVVTFMTLLVYSRGNKPGAPHAGGCLGPRTDLDAVEKTKVICPCRYSNTCRPARSMSLHRLIYHGSKLWELDSACEGNKRIESHQHCSRWQDLVSAMPDVDRRNQQSYGLENRRMSNGSWEREAVPIHLEGGYWSSLYLLTYLLTYLRSWALPEKVPIVQPLRNFPPF